MYNDVSIGRGELIFFLVCNLAITASIFVLGFSVYTLVIVAI